MTHDEMIEVLQAHRDGKTVQNWDVIDRQWVDWDGEDAATLVECMARARFRVKPEPRRLFIPDVFTYTTREGARRAFPQANILEVVEVLL
jgi:hypothetical protein